VLVVVENAVQVEPVGGFELRVRRPLQCGRGSFVNVAAGVPKLFYLPMRSEGFEKPCQVVSHRERHVEVAFC
jgi:hypothetical protein